MNALQTFALFCCALQIQGAPVTQLSTPCWDKMDQIEGEWDRSGGDFPSLYAPDCDEDGVLWQPTQCTYDDPSSCFCVNTQTGETIEGSEFKMTPETINTCIAAIEGMFVSNQGPCHTAFQKYIDFITQNPTVVDSPFGYVPNCESDGYFKAMQSNENHFFCVDVLTGEIFEQSRVGDDDTKPITEEMCQEYPETWEVSGAEVNLINHQNISKTN